jgi:hypothetical protein
MIFSEDSRVKIPCILHLVRLGYRYLRDRLLPLLMNGQVTVA